MALIRYMCVLFSCVSELFDAWGTIVKRLSALLSPQPTTRTSGVILSQYNDGLIFGNPYHSYIADMANTNSRSYTGFGNFNTNNKVPSGVQNSKTVLAGIVKFTPDEVEVLIISVETFTFRSGLVVL